MFVIVSCLFAINNNQLFIYKAELQFYVGSTNCARFILPAALSVSVIMGVEGGVEFRKTSTGSEVGGSAQCSGLK